MKLIAFTPRPAKASGGAAEQERTRQQLIARIGTQLPTMSGNELALVEIFIIGVTRGRGGHGQEGAATQERLEAIAAWLPALSHGELAMTDLFVIAARRTVQLAQLAKATR